MFNSTESQINKVEVVKVESYSRSMKARDHRETKKYIKNTKVCQYVSSSNLGAAGRSRSLVPPGHLAPRPAHLRRQLPEPRPQAGGQAGLRG